MRAEVSRLHFPVTTLGPGRRVGLWLQGCSLRCPGCVSVDTWERGRGSVPLQELVEAVAALAAGADGLTVSGGEPFEQPEALAAVLEGWRAAAGGTVLVFTGLELEDIAPWLSRHPGLVDALMTGPYQAAAPQTLSLRGSDNQRLHALTDAGSEFLQFERPSRPSDRKLDVMFDEDGHAWLAGIPARGDLGRLRRVLAETGHEVRTSDQHGAMAR